MLTLLAQTSTTIESTPRIVGDPLPSWVVVAAGLVVLAVIALAAMAVQRRRR